MPKRQAYRQDVHGHNRPTKDLAPCSSGQRAKSPMPQSPLCRIGAFGFLVFLVTVASVIGRQFGYRLMNSAH